MKFAPQLSTSGTAASVVGSGDVSGMMLREFPPAFCVLATLLAGLSVVVVIHVVTLTAAKRTGRHTQSRPRRGRDSKGWGGVCLSFHVVREFDREVGW